MAETGWIEVVSDLPPQMGGVAGEKVVTIRVRKEYVTLAASSPATDQDRVAGYQDRWMVTLYILNREGPIKMGFSTKQKADDLVRSIIGGSDD